MVQQYDLLSPEKKSNLGRQKEKKNNQPTQNLPMRPPSRDRERRRKQQDLSGLPTKRGAGPRSCQRQRRLGEPQVEADQAPGAADGGGEGGRQAGAGLGAGGLAQRPVVEEVQLVVGRRGV